MYCFEGALVLLVPQLTQYGAGSEGIARVAQYCISNHSTNIINESLLSIEHVDFIRVYSDGAVDHTDTMPLFDIRIPPFLAKRAYYPSAFLETTRARRVKMAARRQTEDEHARRSREGIEHSNNAAGSSNIDNEEEDEDDDSP